MRILILDDEQKFVDDLKFNIEKYMATHLISTEITASVSPDEVLAGGAAFDLAFLDIQMPGADGISVAKALQERNSKTIIFFVTAYEEYQDEAMDLHIFRFFEKPFDEKRLYAGLDKAMEYLDETYVDIFLDKGGSSVRVLVDDIIYIKRENRKITVYTTSGTYLVKTTFEDLVSKLPNTFFYLVHKSFLVNIHYITQYGYKEIYLGETRVSVATRKQADFHKFWFDYIKRR
ncbi:MAG: response regulator transcription factor [Ruminococcaceae bacterium]|nr:response regulator transcription factor [Oscillospiraceae bacterium]